MQAGLRPLPTTQPQQQPPPPAAVPVGQSQTAQVVNVVFQIAMPANQSLQNDPAAAFRLIAQQLLFPIFARHSGQLIQLQPLLSPSATTSTSPPPPYLAPHRVQDRATILPPHQTLQSQAHPTPTSSPTPIKSEPTPDTPTPPPTRASTSPSPSRSPTPYTRPPTSSLRASATYSHPYTNNCSRSRSNTHFEPGHGGGPIRIHRPSTAGSGFPCSESRHRGDRSRRWTFDPSKYVAPPPPPPQVAVEHGFERKIKEATKVSKGIDRVPAALRTRSSVLSIEALCGGSTAAPPELKSPVSFRGSPFSGSPTPELE
ncbi:hypothetical protein DFJ73DRAFT_924246 [Zopfochytrium polystomum]|nr:hypothetical protein DFJ73DRAFT_924246 [Zopfochytrium polystomum]